MKIGLTIQCWGYPDPEQRYIRATDSSDVDMGAVLAQIQDGEERLIAYFNRTLTPPEKN